MSQHNTSQKVEILSQHSNTLSQQRMRRATKETLEFCHGIEIIIMTKPRIEDKKIVATRIILLRQKRAIVQCNVRKVCHDKDSYVVTNYLEINNISHEKFVTTKIMMSRKTF